MLAGYHFIDYNYTQRYSYIVTLVYSGWLSSGDDPLGYVDRVDQRIEDLTGLAMSTAEQLQVHIWTCCASNYSLYF